MCTIHVHNTCAYSFLINHNVLYKEVERCLQTNPTALYQLLLKLDIHVPVVDLKISDNQPCFHSSHVLMANLFFTNHWC